MAMMPARPWRPSWRRAVIVGLTTLLASWAVGELSRAGLARLPGLLASLPGLKPELATTAIVRLRQLAHLMVAIWALASLGRILSTRYRLAGPDLVATEGWLSRRTTLIPLNRVRRFEVRQTPVGRLLHYGTITIEDGSFTPPKVHDVAAPDAVLAALNEASGRTRS